MIFVTLGTQKFQFDRLLKELDKLIDEGKINSNDLIVQCVYSEYVPKNFEMFGMKPQSEVEKIMKESNIVITHSGTGSIITSLKLDKKIIIVPRLKKYDEHVDNHQVELADVFKEKVNAIVVEDMEELYNSIIECSSHDFGKWESNNKVLINSLDNSIRRAKRGI